MRVEHAAADGGVGSFSNIGACLNITLKELRNLVAKDVSGYSDPYCRLKIGDQTFKSTTKFNTLDAVYGEHFQFLDVKPDQVQYQRPSRHHQPTAHVQGLRTALYSLRRHFRSCASGVMWGIADVRRLEIP